MSKCVSVDISHDGKDSFIPVNEYDLVYIMITNEVISNYDKVQVLAIECA